MGPLRRSQQSHIYQKFVEQAGTGINIFPAFPVYRSNLCRIQGGTGNFFSKLARWGRKGFKTVNHHLGGIPQQVAKEVGKAVINDVKRNAAQLITGHKSITDVIKPQHVLDKTFSAVKHAAINKLSSFPDAQEGHGQMHSQNSIHSAYSREGSELYHKKRRKLNAFGEYTPV